MLLLASRPVQLCCRLHGWLVSKAQKWLRSLLRFIPDLSDDKIMYSCSSSGFLIRSVVGLKQSWIWRLKGAIPHGFGEGFLVFFVRFIAVRTRRAGQQQTFAVFATENPPSTLSTVVTCGLSPRKEIDNGRDLGWDAMIHPWGGLDACRNSPLNLSTQNRNYLLGGIRGKAEGKMGICQL